VSVWQTPHQDCNSQFGIAASVCLADTPSGLQQPVWN
jgi:hypothetical protein